MGIVGNKAFRQHHHAVGSLVSGAVLAVHLLLQQGTQQGLEGLEDEVFEVIGNILAVEYAVAQHVGRHAGILKTRHIVEYEEHLAPRHGMDGVVYLSHDGIDCGVGALGDDDTYAILDDKIAQHLRLATGFEQQFLLERRLAIVEALRERRETVVAVQTLEGFSQNIRYTFNTTYYGVDILIGDKQ